MNRSARLSGIPANGPVEAIDKAWFQRQILDWFAAAGRKNLPWQQNKTAYRVWLSEIMLQQTQVATVIPYFERFTQRFPTVESLAQATQDEVLHLWSGLGYYARARNLHRAATRIVAEFAGCFPASVEEMATLPGVGRSTAAAVVSSVYGVRAAILDGNVKRVLSRFFALAEWPGSGAAQRQLWQWSEWLTPEQQVAHYNQAMMDIGALVCTRTKPACLICPLAARCQALASNQTDKLPLAKPKKAKPVKTTLMLMLQLPTGEVYLQPRAASGIWGGLFSFAEFDSITELQQQLSELDVQSVSKWEPLRHTFSHFHLDISPVQVRLNAAPATINEAGGRWIQPGPLAEPEQPIGVPAPINRLLQSLAQRR